MHGYKDTVDVSVGAICAVLNRNNKEFCRVRIECIASSGMVRSLIIHSWGDHGNTKTPISTCKFSQLTQSVILLPLRPVSLMHKNLHKTQNNFI